MKRWHVKRNGDPKVYALTNTLADAQLLADRLTRSTGETFYAKIVEKQS